MIIRAIFDHPALLDQPFDFFNDARDTLGWLAHMRDRHPMAAVIETQLRQKYDAWLIASRERLKA